MIKRETLKTEQQNKNSLEIDRFTVSKILDTINKEDQKIALAVNEVLSDVEEVVLYANLALVAEEEFFMWELGLVEGLVY